MSGWWIAMLVVLCLILLGQLRLGAGGKYTPSGAEAWARAGPLRIRFYPKTSKHTPRKTKLRKAAKPTKPAKSAKGERPPAGAGGLWEQLQAYLPLILEAAGYFRKKLRIDRLDLCLTVGGGDPGDAALWYGRANALLGAVWLPLNQAFDVAEGRARVQVDFDAASPTLYGEFALSLKLGQLLWMGLFFGWKGIVTLLQNRNRQKQHRKAA